MLTSMVLTLLNRNGRFIFWPKQKKIICNNFCVVTIVRCLMKNGERNDDNSSKPYKSTRDNLTTKRERYTNKYKETGHLRKNQRYLRKNKKRGKQKMKQTLKTPQEQS